MFEIVDDEPKWPITADDIEAAVKLLKSRTYRFTCIATPGQEASYYFPIIPTVSYKVFFEADVGRKEAKRRKGIVQWLTDFLNYKYD